jgi:hypothetical protein
MIFGTAGNGSTPLRFDRREQKFVVSADGVERMLPEVESRLIVDPHADEQGGYFVSSLYFDNEDRDVYWERARGVTPRHKLRVRVYAPDGPRATFLEIKTRLRRRVVKRRMSTTVQEALAICSGQAPDRHLEPAEALLVSDVHSMVAARDLAPMCLIRYYRRAWLGPDALRVTVDSELSFRTRGLEDFAAPEWDGELLPPDKRVLEVKYPDAIPYWLATLVARHGGAMRRFSKYCHAAELSGLARLPDPTTSEAATYFRSGRSDAWKPSTAS